jgi:hypothetical protein
VDRPIDESTDEPAGEPRETPEEPARDVLNGVTLASQADIVDIVHGDPVAVDPEFDDDPAALAAPMAPDSPTLPVQDSNGDDEGDEVVMEPSAVEEPDAPPAVVGAPGDLESGADDDTADAAPSGASGPSTPPGTAGAGEADGAGNGADDNSATQ